MSPSLTLFVLSILTLRSTGIPFEGDEPLSDSDEEYPDEADEDSNGEKSLILVSFHHADHFSAEEYYKNDYPEDEGDSGKFFDRDISKLTFHSLR